MDKLTKISFIIALLGILLLIILSQQIQPKVVDIKDVKNMSLYKQVAVIGEMITVSNYDEFQVILIQDDTGLIKVTSNSKEPINKTTDEILVIGKTDEYKGEIQIQANKIIILED